MTWYKILLPDEAGVEQILRQIAALVHQRYRAVGKPEGMAVFTAIENSLDGSVQRHACYISPIAAYYSLALLAPFWPSPWNVPDDRTPSFELRYYGESPKGAWDLLTSTVVTNRP